MLKVFLISTFLSFLIPSTIFARTTPEDLRQTRRTEFQSSLAKINDTAKKELVVQGDQLLDEINQKVSGRFDVEIARLGAILDELKSREGVTDTIVAYGQGETPLDNAAYYLNFAAEASAYQKAQDYTPRIGGGNLGSAFTISMNNLSGNLKVLQGKVLRAKSEVGKAVSYYEK